MAERRAPLIIGITAVTFVGVILLWAFSSNDRTLSASLTAVTDKSVIAKSVQVAHISIATGENFVGHRIRVISGAITNTSDKPLRLVEMKMVFTDYDGKPIQESVQKGFEGIQKPLAPGMQHRFEVNFENLPKNWNYHVPNVEVVKLAY